LAVFNAVAQEVETTVSGGVTVAVATSGDGETFNRVMAERIDIGYISVLRCCGRPSLELRRSARSAEGPLCCPSSWTRPSSNRHRRSRAAVVLS